MIRRTVRMKEIEMPLARNFACTVKARAERDPEFRFGLFEDAVEALLSDDIATGKVLLRHYVNAAGGFEKLAIELGSTPNSLKRMLSDQGNPCADSFLRMIGHLRRQEGAVITLTQ